MSRHVAPTRPILDRQNVSAIILSAGEGRRLRSYGNRALIPIGDTNLINHQIKVVKDKCSEVIVVGGYDADKVYRTLPPNVKMVENEGYAQTNSMRSLSIALRICLAGAVLIVHGDIFFDTLSLNGFTNVSAVTIDKHNRIENDKVGITTERGLVVHCDYGISPKWAQLLFLTGQELELARKFASDRTKDNLTIAEGINLIIARGGKIKTVEVDQMGQLKEFNTLGDINGFK